MPQALLADASVCNNGLCTSKSEIGYAQFIARRFKNLCVFILPQSIRPDLSVCCDPSNRVVSRVEYKLNEQLF